MPPDLDLLTQAIADFENGEDLRNGNPFDVDHAESYAHVVQAFVTGCTVPDMDIVQRAAGSNAKETQIATAMAAFFQGLAIGYDYAVRGVEA